MRLLLGDCVELVATLGAESVDAVVTDPPYGLGFMGKGWDASGIANSVPMWLQVFRVLKPGGHLVAFGGSRTYHRMVCAAEDAGFEIRDQLMWLAGSGFPKSHNFGCSCRSEPIPYNHAEGENELLGMRQGSVAPSVPLETDQEPDVLLRMQRESQGQGIDTPLTQGSGGVDGGKPQVVSTEDDRAEQSGVEGRSDLPQQEGQLSPISDQACSLPAGPDGDGPQGRLSDGASVDRGSTGRPDSDADGSGEPSGSQSGEQHAVEPGAMADERGSQAGGGGPVCGRCGKLADYAGYGTALKPAHEPIVLARKPLIGTVAENVLEHGVGGLNVDECRIETEKPVQMRGTAGMGYSGSKEEYEIGEGRLYGERGRWPANVLLDEVAAGMLDEQTGAVRSSGTFSRGNGPQGDKDGAASIPIDGLSGSMYADSGGASRFFYTAKASSSERNAGLDGGVGALRDGGRANTAPRHNTHPTVKPIDLMRWLIRLITPPHGLVLDPFLGSGTTGIAAHLEAKDFVGIELSAEYMRIAEARIRHWSAQQVLF